MQALRTSLSWPILTLLVVGGSHFLAEVLRPALHDVITPATVMPIYLSIGAWAGITTNRGGGRWGLGVAAGAALGVLPLALQIVGFGMLLARDADAVITAGLFGFLGLTWGAAIGAGVGARLDPSTAMSLHAAVVIPPNPATAA